MEFKTKKQPKQVVTAIKYDLSQYLFKEREFFSSILKCMIEEDVDLSIKRTNRWWKTTTEITKEFNEKILVSLVVTKRFYYLWKGRHLTNGELVCIRWLEVDSWSLRPYYKKYSNLKKLPKMYEKAFDRNRKVMWISTYLLAEIIKKDLSKCSFHKYIKSLDFDQYSLCIKTYLHKFWTYGKSEFKDIIIKALAENFNWLKVKWRLDDLYIGTDLEKSLEYKTSFDKVYNSPKIRKNLWKTWDRFYNIFPEEIEGAFSGVIKSKK